MHEHCNVPCIRTVAFWDTALPTPLASSFSATQWYAPLSSGLITPMMKYCPSTPVSWSSLNHRTVGAGIPLKLQKSVTMDDTVTFVWSSGCSVTLGGVRISLSVCRNEVILAHRSVCVGVCGCVYCRCMHAYVCMRVCK